MKGKILAQGIITANDKRYTYDDADLKNGDVKNGDEVDFLPDEETQKAREIYKINQQAIINGFDFNATDVKTIKIFGIISSVLWMFVILGGFGFIFWVLGLASFYFAIDKIAKYTKDEEIKRYTFRYLASIFIAVFAMIFFIMGSLGVMFFTRSLDPFITAGLVGVIAILLYALHNYIKIYEIISIKSGEKLFVQAARFYAFGLVFSLVPVVGALLLLAGVLLTVYAWTKLEHLDKADNTAENKPSST